VGRRQEEMTHMTSTIATALLLFPAMTFANAAAVTAVTEDAEIEVEMAAPETVTVGDTYALEVTITNQGSEMIIIKEPMHDYRSFDFRVKFGDKRESLYTKYHPKAGQPSTLKGQDLEAGASLTFRHEVDAITAGEWRFEPLYHGAGGTITGEAKTVTVEAKGKAERALAEMKTSHGVIRAAFWPDVAPATSLSIAELVRTGFYDGLIFHRVIQGFMIQGGCPDGNGMGGPGYSIEAEFNKRSHVAGVFSMARNGDPYEGQGKMPRPQFANSAGSQFFLCDATSPHLDKKYTGFGRVIEGIDVVHAIAAVPVDGSSPKEPVKIEKARLVVIGAGS